MAVDNHDVIDACGVDNVTGEVVLSIADHLPWSDTAHLAALQAKINRYLDFIESGQLIDDYPASKGRSICIAVWFKWPPDGAGIEFIAKAELFLRGRNCRLTCHFPNAEPLY